MTRVLLVADDCNPEWPSLPIVTYRYAIEIAKRCDAVVATHVRNRVNIENASPAGIDFFYVDNEYIAAPMHKFSEWLRGGGEVAWSTNMIFKYLPYLEFERQVWKSFRKELKDRRFDLVHRLSPMSPTMPSYLAKRCPVPFVLGPLNGNLAWPIEFAEEQRREREGLRVLRRAYKQLPYVKSTYRNAAAILAAFSHTVPDLIHADPDRIIDFPEVGYEPSIFYPPAQHRHDRQENLEFLFVGRLVPYKAAEAVVRAFKDAAMSSHRLTVIGDGPERSRLEAFASEAAGRVAFAGHLDQAKVAEAMRRADVFVFPSVRELGAGVVVEAMASALPSVVANYGAPGTLIDEDTGLRVPVDRVDKMAKRCTEAMLALAEDPRRRLAMGAAAARKAKAEFTWSRKSEKTIEIYKSLTGIK